MHLDIKHENLDSFGFGVWSTLVVRIEISTHRKFWEVNPTPWGSLVYCRRVNAKLFLKHHGKVETWQYLRILDYMTKT
jgi:hypothetical protein